MNYSTSSFIKIVLIYFLVIGFVFLWSGSKREKTIFDNYLIRLEGSTFKFYDDILTKDFYSKILELKLTSESKEELIYLLPDNRKIIGYKNNNEEFSKSELLITVKNGFSKLHSRLKKRILDNNFGSSSITEIFKNKNNKEFILSDPSGNKIRFLN